MEALRFGMFGKGFGVVASSLELFKVASDDYEVGAALGEELCELFAHAVGAASEKDSLAYSLVTIPHNSLTLRWNSGTYSSLDLEFVFPAKETHDV